MKRIFQAVAIFIAVMLFFSCKKDQPAMNYSFTEGQALLKINYASPYRSNPAVQVKINDQRVSSNILYAYPYPGGGLNTMGSSLPLYFPVNPGQTKISLSIPKANSNVDSILLYSTTQTLEANKLFTAHITDTAASTQTFLVNDDIATPDSGLSRYKFINLMPNLPAVDLYFGTALVAANVAYKTSGAPFTLPSAATGQWFIRPAGAAATTTAITSYPTGTTLYTVPVRRVLTIFSRGYNGITATTDVRRPQISLLYNR